MTRTRIKICGIQDIPSAHAAIAAGADSIGLVFVEKSPRYVTNENAKKIVESLPAFVTPVGLFVDQSPEQIIDTAQHVGLNTVQLHGSETPEFATYLKNLNIIKALPFNTQEQLTTQLTLWKQALPILKAIIVDAPPAKGLTGGTGETFDWQALKNIINQNAFKNHAPLILAGGLNPKNIAEAITQIKPFAVDVSSGVESSRGVKDLDLIKQFCNAAQDADAQ